MRTASWKEKRGIVPGDKKGKSKRKSKKNNALQASDILDAYLATFWSLFKNVPDQTCLENANFLLILVGKNLIIHDKSNNIINLIKYDKHLATVSSLFKSRRICIKKMFYEKKNFSNYIKIWSYTIYDNENKISKKDNFN